MTATTVWILLIALACLAIGAAAGLWAGRRLPADPEQTLGSTVAPLSDSLDRVERFLQSTETQRAAAHGELREQVRSMHDLQSTLSTHTTALVNALRAPHVRGRWGEMQLRRIVESSGMIDHCDFTEQHSVSGEDGRLRPDLVVHLTGDRNVVVDSKVPFTAFIEAVECTDDATRARLHREHAKQVRSHLDLLSSKGYAAALGDTPEFVVMFLPSDAFLQLALQSEPSLLERGFDRDVVIATPSTLLALLRTVAHTWRQDTVSTQAQEILELGQVVHQRLATFAGHLGKIGGALSSATARYNDAVGSFERSVLPATRRMHEHGIARTPIEGPERIEQSIRELHAADPPAAVGPAVADAGVRRRRSAEAG